MWIEGLVLVIVLALAGWELYSLHRDKKRTEREKQQRNDETP